MGGEEGERWEERRGRKEEGRKQRRKGKSAKAAVVTRVFRNSSAGGVCHGPCLGNNALITGSSIPPPLVEIWPMSLNYVRRKVFSLSELIPTSVA